MKNTKKMGMVALLESQALVMKLIKTKIIGLFLFFDNRFKIFELISC